MKTLTLHSGVYYVRCEMGEGVLYVCPSVTINMNLIRSEVNGGFLK